MNTNDLNTALYEKMAAEQDKYRDWLKSQPPEEILHHTYEYTVREDIVMAMEDLELTDAQAQALLDSPTPLADVYRHFEKLETGYMDVIRDSIENRADDVCKVLEEQRSIPLYLHSAAYASQHGEMAIPMPEDSGTSRHCAYLVVDEVNLGLTDLFTRQARKTLQEPEKGSVLQKLKQEPTTHKPALSKKQEPER